MTIEPAKGDELMVVFFFSYEFIGVTLHNSFKRHYTLPYMKDRQWLYYDDQLKPPHTQSLTAEIIQGSVNQHVQRQNKQQSTGVLQD